jgi:XamI restriction endonuclease
MVHEVRAEGVPGNPQKDHRERGNRPARNERSHGDHARDHQVPSRHFADPENVHLPPLARDRLIGLADSSKNLVGTLEEGKLPPQIDPALLDTHLERIVKILSQMLDVDIFPWLEGKRRPTEEERYRSSTIVADRLCGAVAEPIVRNAQEKRQLALIEQYLTQRGLSSKRILRQLR